MTVFDYFRFVLVRTTHPGNIGASARAIKNMGFSNLVLVAPKYFPNAEASARASGADDVLSGALVREDLIAAVADCNIIVGTSSRKRSVQIPLITPKELACLVSEKFNASTKIALVFGQERTGLTNEELAACHYHLYIPCNPHYPSLNLGAAVQIVAYELFNSLNSQSVADNADLGEIVSAEDMERFYEHLESTLVNLDFLNPQNPRQLMRKLRRLFNRVAIERTELNILRGILTTINQKCN